MTASPESSTLVVMPAKRQLVREVVLNLGESVLVPMLLVYVLVLTSGLLWALLAAVVWAVAAVVVRAVRGSGPPVLLLVATGVTLVRVVITYLANSATAYYLQPTLATYLFAAALLAGLSSQRPLIQRLADDFCPLPTHVVAADPVRRLFRHLSMLWGAVLTVNASVTLSLLLTMSTTWSVPLATAASVPAFGVGLALSLVWFRRSLHAGGFALVWGTAD